MVGSKISLCRSAFTLIEITFVIAIIAVIAVISIPYFNQAMLSSSRTTCEYNLLAVGMAIKAYANDLDRYPSTENLIAELHTGNYLKSGLDLRCPLDKTELGNTYSIGYMGGHPLTIQPDDPLVVCGHHTRIGTLAVFGDDSVGVLNEKKNNNNEIVPITIKQSGENVEPGFVLHNADALVIESEDGNEVSVYGNDDAYYISAAYDPTAYDGVGMFTITIGFDSGFGTDASVWAEGTSYVTFQTSTITTKVEITGSPYGNSPTKLNYARTSFLSSYLGLEFFQAYELTHMPTGKLIASEVPSSLAEFGLTLSGLDQN